MPQWVTGFCDRSASFGLTLYSNKGKWAFKLVFEVLVDVKYLYCLEYLKNFFGVGKIYVVNKTATFRVTAISDLFPISDGNLVIINHFSRNPLISPKMITYALWAEVVNLIWAKKHLNTNTFEYILSIYAALGRGASKAAMQAFPTLTPISLPSYIVPVSVDTINPWWISGYLTLYCSFSLSVTGGGWKESVYNKFRHSFSFSFNILSLGLAQVIASFLLVSCYVRTSEQRVCAQVLGEWCRSPWKREWPS